MNTLDNIGDILIVDFVSSITGKVAILSYEDNLVGLTDTRNVNRQFKLSADGLFWDDWNELTNDNLALTQYTVDGFLFIKIRYIRIGTDSTGSITFNSINFTGTREVINFVAPTLKSSILNGLIGTNDFYDLERNLFKKLYHRGILPKYILRGDNYSYIEDKDFIDLFFSVARFFALIISFSKQLENFLNNSLFLREQLRSYNIAFNESSITLQDLQFLCKNLLSQIQQRGTKMIFNRKGNILPNGKSCEIDGEFVRLLRNKISDELLFEIIPLHKMGWCMSQSSPLYCGTSNSFSLNKTKEKTEDFQDLSNFLISKSGGGNYSLVTSSDGKKVLRLTTTSDNSQVGLGRINALTDVSNNIYVIDSQLDYEITFAFKINSADNKENVNILFGAEGFDILKNKLIDAFVTPNGDMISEQFFNQKISIWKNDIWYFARGIIHAYSSKNISQNTTNLGIGNDLYFNNSFVKYFIPKIQIISSSATQIDIWNYKIRPLIRGKNIISLKKEKYANFQSMGFIQASKFSHTYARNNNNSQSQEDIIDFIERYLYSFNIIDIFTIMSNYN